MKVARVLFAQCKSWRGHNKYTCRICSFCNKLSSFTMFGKKIKNSKNVNLFSSRAAPRKLKLRQIYSIFRTSTAASVLDQFGSGYLQFMVSCFLWIDWLATTSLYSWTERESLSHGQKYLQQITQPFSLVWLPPIAFPFMYIKSLCTLGLRANGATIPYAFPSLHFLVLKDFLWSTSQYCRETLQWRSGLISFGSLAMVKRVWNIWSTLVFFFADISK